MSDPKLARTTFSPEKEAVVETNPEADKVQSYPWFDWLRFALASVVVLGHANFQFAPFLNGSLAVRVFLALSGWLIGGILLRTDISELARFFFNRSTRIWVPYFVAIMLLYGIAALREGLSFFWLKYLVMDMTFTHQLFAFFPVAKFEMPLGGSGNQFWSIAVEEQFYLLTPLVMLFVPKGKTIAMWLFISAVALTLGSHFGTISLGVCAAVLQRDYRIADRPWVRLMALCLILGCAFALSMNVSNWFSMYAGPLFSVAVVVFLAVPGQRNKLALFLGGLSYPLYLNHWLALAFIHGTAKYLGLLGMSALPFIAYLTAVISTVPLYWWVDRQVQKRRNEWYSPKLGMRLGFAAYALVVIGIIAGILMHQYGPHGTVPSNLITSGE